MALKEQDIVLVAKDVDGSKVIQMPITRVENVEGAIKTVNGNKPDSSGNISLSIDHPDPPNDYVVNISATKGSISVTKKDNSDFSVDIASDSIIKISSQDNKLVFTSKNGNISTDVPTFYYGPVGFRQENTRYQLGDIVHCMFNPVLFLECTKSGTTSAASLDTRTVTHGQVLTDGTLQWTVKTYIKSINGNTANEDGDVTLNISNSWNDLEGKPNFHHVATSGNYNDLINKPTIPPEFKYSYSTTDLSAGSSPLETGKVHFVYE